MASLAVAAESFVVAVVAVVVVVRIEMWAWSSRRFECLEMSLVVLIVLIVCEEHSWVETAVLIVMLFVESLRCFAVLVVTDGVVE